MPLNPSPLLEFSRIRDYEKSYLADVHDDVYFGFPVQGILEGERALYSPAAKAVAYFSMEYGLATNSYNIFVPSHPIKPANIVSENEIFSNERVADYFFSLKINTPLDLPIYSGGLGVLAGDTIKTAADLRLPFAGVGILWNKGYFKQRFWFKFGQLPEEMKWDPTTFPGLVPLEQRVTLDLKDRDIHLRLWKYYVYSRTQDYAVPLVLLDSNVPENDEAARRLTDQLYRSDDPQGRLLQRLILGMGGMKALDALGYPVNKYHLNEGHAAFAFIQKARGMSAAQADEWKSRFAYTCHTPVPAGHDRFGLSDLERVLKPEDVVRVRSWGLEDPKGAVVNLTVLAMNTSSSINAVAKKHGDVMKLQFPAYKDRIRFVTNGVHQPTWMSSPVAEVLDGYREVLGDFRADPLSLAKVAELRGNEEFRSRLWAAHQANKKNLARLLDHWKIREDVLTIAWARRIAAYKRPGLLFQDMERLRDIARRQGPLQILYAGKAHPNDNMAFTYINEIMNTIDKAGDGQGGLKIIMLENYDTYIAKMLVSGVDVWLNNPVPPHEASGTSGMKAIANGVLQLSTLDGWVVEAADKPIGRFFGHRDDGQSFSEGLNLRLPEDSRALYDTLEEMAGLYYGTEGARRSTPAAAWIDMMIGCVETFAHFNTVRMVNEYRRDIWGL